MQKYIWADLSFHTPHSPSAGADLPKERNMELDALKILEPGNIVLRKVR